MEGCVRQGRSRPPPSTLRARLTPALGDRGETLQSHCGPAGGLAEELPPEGMAWVLEGAEQDNREDLERHKFAQDSSRTRVSRAVLGDHFLRHVVIITERRCASRPRVSAALATLSARSIGIVRTRAAPAVRRS
jgi:hypothetical protein